MRDRIYTYMCIYIYKVYSKPMKKEIIYYSYFTSISNLGSCKAESLKFTANNLRFPLTYRTSPPFHL